jgi:hypothetical protein
MNTKNVTLFAILSIVLLSGAALALTPGLPHQFFGTVNINGAPAPDGTIVSARIDGAEVKNVPTANGKYGLVPGIFYVDDFNHNREGNLIRFFVDGVDTGATAYFANGKSTELNLAITVAVASPQQSGGGGGSGGSAIIIPNKTANATQQITSTRTSVSGGACTERWVCDAWSECIDGMQKRTCTESNKCGTIEDLPQTSQPCAGENEYSASELDGKSNSITGLFTAIASPTGAGIIALILVAAYFLANAKKTRSKGWNYSFGK